MTNNPTPNATQFGLEGKRRKCELACKEAIDGLVLAGNKMLEYEGKTFPRFNEVELEYGRALMRMCFYGFRGHRGNAGVASFVHFGFVLTCLKYNLSGLPGQDCPWYPRYVERVEKFLRSKEGKRPRS